MLPASSPREPERKTVEDAMKKRITRCRMAPVVAAIVLILLAACDHAGLTEEPWDYGRSEKGAGMLTVMTRNVYVGGNVDLILTAAPEDVPVVVAQVFQQMVATNFAERAQAFAEEIAATKPHLVGLQEISRIRTQSPGDFILGTTEPNAEHVFLDQLEVLMQALQAAGLDYRVIGVVENLDVEAPMLMGTAPPSFDDVRLTDFDVLLARSDVETANVAEVNYAAALPVPGLGVLTRGYVAADAAVDGRTFRVFTSHLEPVTVPEILPVQLGQIEQLAAATEGLDVPVIVMGDLNTEPGRAGYAALMAAGLVDLWEHNVRPGLGLGFTCCFPDDLRGDSRTPDQRIDLVLYKPATPSHGHDGLGAVVMDLVGEEAADVTPSGLWPSDHVGVVARLVAPASAWAR
jgi:hypothetical protein